MSDAVGLGVVRSSCSIAADLSASPVNFMACLSRVTVAFQIGHVVHVANFTIGTAIVTTSPSCCHS